MLSFSKSATCSKAAADAPGRLCVAAPVSSRQCVRRLAPVARPALLLEQPLDTGDSRRMTNAFTDFVNMVLHLLEPQEESHVGEEQLLAELSASMDHENGHGGWVHSHIADRLATEPSSRVQATSEGF